MEKLANNKKYLTLILVGLLSLVMGVSLSYIQFDLSSNDNSLQTGQISMSYTEPSNTVVLKDALPKSDQLGTNQPEFFEFSVMTHITTNKNDDKGYSMPYEISISKTAIDKMFNTLKDSDIKIYLTKITEQNEEITVVEPTLISNLKTSDFDKNSYKIYDGRDMHHNNNDQITTKYRIRFWIAETVDATNWYKENKYEYRFVVNINSYAEKNNALTLSQIIKKLYNEENNTAFIKNNTYYLSGPEEQSSSSQTIPEEILSNFVSAGSVYLYKENTLFRTDLLEKHIYDYMIENSIVSKEEFEAVTSPFGGYVNAMLAYAADMVDLNTFSYIGEYTINDIPSIEEVLNNDSQTEKFLDMINEPFYDMFTQNPKYFLELYEENNNINESLLNKNIELGIINILDAEFLIDIINQNFGSFTNYVVAEAYGLTEYDDNGMPSLVEGAQLPSLAEIFIGGSSQEIVYITNNYIELNDTLYEIISINNDNSINLIETKTDQKYLTIKTIEDFKTNKYFKYYGIIDDEKINYYSTIKNTTLGEIIKLNNNKYIEVDYNFNELQKIELKGYKRFISTEELKNTYNKNGSFLKGYYTTNSISEGYYNYDIRTAYLREEDINYDSSNSNRYNAVITIDDIYVLGEGTEDNPYYITDEKKSTNEQVAINIKNYISAVITNASGEDKHQVPAEFEKINAENSYYVKDDEDDFTEVSVNIGDKCYNVKNDNKIIISDLQQDGCQVGIYPKIINHPKSVTTYSFNETTFTVEANNATNYKWQQGYFDEENRKIIWIDLEDLDGRIMGTTTNTLTIFPTSFFNQYTYIRCIVANENKSIDSGIAEMKLILTDGEWKYEEIDNTNKYKIISYIGDYTNSAYFEKNDENKYDLTIPANINGDLIINVDNVESYKDSQYPTWGNVEKEITSITIENGIKEINAIIDSELIELKLNNGLEKIGSRVFYYSKLKELILPSSIKTIGDSAFYSSELKELTLQNQTESIGNYAFYNSESINLNLGENIKTIGKYAFANSIPEKLILPNSITTIGEGAFRDSLINEIALPESLEEIGDAAFYSSKIEEIEWNEKIKKIGAYAFYNAELTSLILPESLEEIGEGAFYSSPLTTLTLNEGLKKIYDTKISHDYEDLLISGHHGAFHNAELTQITLPSTLIKIGNCAFYNSKLTSLNIPSSVIEIGAAAFYSSELTSLNLSEGIKQINSYLEFDDSLFGHRTPYGAFENAKLTTLTLPNSLTYLGPLSFYSSPLTKLKISNNLEYIERHTFYSAQLTKLEIPASVKIIKAAAFYSSPLTELKLNEGLKSLETQWSVQVQVNNNDPASSIQHTHPFAHSNITSIRIPSTYALHSITYPFGGREFKNIYLYGRESFSDEEIKEIFNVAENVIIVTYPEKLDWQKIEQS